MDRSWMRASRLSDEYEHGVKEFLQFAESNAIKELPPPKSNVEKSLPVLFLCPCIRCVNRKPKLNKKEIMDHLICEGICQSILLTKKDRDFSTVDYYQVCHVRLVLMGQWFMI
jgi:hypothetical protein